METCVNGNEILNCYSPPPVFDIEKPSWCFTPTETPIPSTELTTTGEPTTITETTATTTVISAISSTISTILSSTQGTRTKEPTEASSTTTRIVTTEPPEEPVATEAPENLVPIIVPCAVIIGILIIVLIVLYWKKRQKERENQQAAARITYDSQRSTVGLVNGSNETDGAMAATSPQKESFSHKNEFSIAENENELPTKEVEDNKEKRAPIVPSTEL